MEEKGNRFTEANWGIKKKKKIPTLGSDRSGNLLQNIHSYIAQSYTLLEKEKIQKGCSFFSF